MGGTFVNMRNHGIRSYIKINALSNDYQHNYEDSQQKKVFRLVWNSPVVPSKGLSVKQQCGMLGWKPRYGKRLHVKYIPAKSNCSFLSWHTIINKINNTSDWTLSYIWQIIITKLTYIESQALQVCDTSAINFSDTLPANIAVSPSHRSSSVCAVILTI